MPDLSERLHRPELMDEFERPPEEFARALRDLRIVNQWLGGFGAVRSTLRPLLEEVSYLRVLDLGTGLADIPAQLVRWADRHQVLLQVVALDANPTVVRQARAYLDERLHPRFRGQVLVEVGDALEPGYEADDFDVVIASLFLHHLEDEKAVELLRRMDRLARRGLVVNDLHRHKGAFWGITALAKLLPMSAMSAHDGPLSVRRAFTRGELADLAEKAGLRDYELRWHWAFRWILSSID